ncbi:MAG TPA: protein kinase [Vicinamibacteria bacterium]|nr:protein kinase [Vicinamibacteria bacterium]
MVGATLGHYRITAALGAGGMGEVYRATDTKLGRDVAIKVLPAELAADPERLTRFEREAKLLASLNHPNIAHVYGFESALPEDGSTTHFLAMELVEGEDLAERLKHGPIPVDEALPLARQIAAALEEAHEKGIVHRDLKPANVKLTLDGKVKVLDFGLAKAYAGDAVPGSSAELSQSPTLAHTGTQAGVILGTAAYMSPEQARGKPVDKRADIWAFGVVLFEMLTARRLFTGETTSDVLAGVLKTEIDLAALPTSTPPAVHRLLRGCLERNPTNRLHDIADARIAIDDLLRGPDRDERPEAVVARPRWSRRQLIGVACAGLVVGGLAGHRAARPSGPGEAPALGFERLTFRFGHFVNARFAPDGQAVFYAAAWEGRPRELFQARPGSGGELSLGQVGADLLAVSPTGELAILIPTLHGSNSYLKSGTLALLPASGGTPRELAEDVVWADWAPDGKTLAVIRKVGGGRVLEYPLGTVLYRVPHEHLIWPRVSPDGARVAVFEKEKGGFSVVVIDRSGARRRLSAGWVDWWNLAWSPRGDEVWFGGTREGLASALYAVGLLGRERSLMEAPGTLEIHDVRPDGRALVANVRARGHMFGREPGAAKEKNLAWLETSTVADLSDDGRRLLFKEYSEREGGKIGAYLRDLSGTAAIRLGEGDAQDLSPDGKWALALREGEIAALPTGAGAPRVRRLPFSELATARFLPDGDRVVLVAREGDGPRRLFIAGLGAEPLRALGPEIRLRGRSNRDSQSPLVSPDGRLVAYPEAAGGIAIVPIEGGNELRVPDVGVNELPIQWTADGRRLYIFDPGQLPARVFTVDIERGERRPVREIELRDPAGVTGVDAIVMTRDGQSYAYSYQQSFSDLFLVAGLR